MTTPTIQPPALAKPRAPRASISSRPDGDLMNAGTARAHSPYAENGAIVPYGSAFESIANLHIPEDPHEMFYLCKQLCINSPVHKAYVANMARLAASQEPKIKRKNAQRTTRTRYDDSDQDILLSREDLITQDVRDVFRKSIRIKKLNQRVGVRYWTYSSAVVMLHFPFIKMLECQTCKYRFRADEVSWGLTSSGTFSANCTRCGCTKEKYGLDHYVKDPHGVRVSCPDMTHIYTISSGRGPDIEAYYRIPRHVQERVQGCVEYADQEFILSQPQAYINACMDPNAYGDWSSGEPYVKLREDQFFLLENVNLEFTKEGIPIPSFVSSFATFHQMRQLERASESIAKGYITPLDILYPEASSRTGNLFEMFNMSGYMDVIREEMAIWRKDPNYRPIFPFPVASTRIGGDGKALLLSSEIRVYMEILCAALECPIEFIFGGLSYSGSDVSIQQMVSKIEDYRDDLLLMNEWLVDRVCTAMDLPPHIVEFDEFRMGQDLPHLQLLLSSYAQGIVSLRRVHEAMNIETETERSEMIRDLLYQTGIERIRMKVTSEAQNQIAKQQQIGAAEGSVLSQEALIEETRKLAERVRADAELLAHVQADPQKAMAIFGPNSPEVTHQSANAFQSQVPQTPDPALVAPGGEMGTQALEYEEAQEMTPDQLFEMESILPDGGAQLDQYSAEQIAQSSDANEMVLSLSQEGVPLGFQTLGPEDIDAAIHEFKRRPVEQWPSLLSEIRNAFGDSAARQISAILSGTLADVGQRSTYARGNRDEMLDYGHNM